MSYNFEVSATVHFAKEVKRLSKKYPSLKADITKLISELTRNPLAGTPIGSHCHKIRLKITSKNTGKSGGARVITFLKISAKKIVLIDIFDKSAIDNITDKYLAALLKELKDQSV